LSAAPRILILYFSRKGHTEALARQIALGVESEKAVSLLRTVPPVSPVSEATAPEVPPEGPPYVELAELASCDGLILGSPTRFGNMASALKYFLDTRSSLWRSGALAGKPGAVFTSSSSLHGGQESTLLSMALPLIHHGMLFVGVPYTEATLFATRSGGSPYGATRITADWSDGFTDDEKAVARALGARVAVMARRLAVTGLKAADCPDQHR
jgi:NAD(P)H dehydrogenase (quinone)